MDLFNNQEKPVKIKRDSHANDHVPDGLFLACPYCSVQLYAKQLGEYSVCPACGYGFRLKARDRMALMADQFVELDADLEQDQTDFPKYADKLAHAKELTDLKESVLTGIVTMDNVKVAMAIMDSNFIMGSLGQVTGEKITRLIETATKRKLPVVLFSASGGARMQEGIHSLMQMAKVSGAIASHQEAGLLYMVVLTDPTMGGVTASFAMDGDITLAEPHALIGFAGRRVIEQTIHEKLPKEFQRAEQLLNNGFVDAIVQRADMKDTLVKLIKFHQINQEID